MAKKLDALFRMQSAYQWREPTGWRRQPRWRIKFQANVEYLGAFMTNVFIHIFPLWIAAKIYTTWSVLGIIKCFFFSIKLKISCRFGSQRVANIFLTFFLSKSALKNWWPIFVIEFQYERKYIEFSLSFPEILEIE